MKIYEYKRNYELERDYWCFVGIRSMIDALLDICLGRGRLGKVLDVGCGTGALLDKLKDRSEELWGLDNSEEALSFCRMRGHKNLVLADATNTGFSAEYFDVITAIGIIEHIDDDNSFIVEMSRILKPGGIIILLTSSFQFLWSLHDVANDHKRRYYLREIRRLMHKNRFETVQLTHLNFFLFLPIACMLLVHRLIFGTRSDKPERLLIPVHPVINYLLTLILKFEAWLMHRVVFPWGISMIGAFRKIK